MKKILSAVLLFIVSITIHSQNENPFQKFGYDVLVATSSKGEFEEFHDQTEVVEIGSVLFNTRTNEIVRILDKDETTIDISSATAAMSIDPLCEKYYWISPYVYCANNPIRFIDPDGKDWIENSKTGDVEWRRNVNADNTPKGYNYIGESYKGFSISQTYTNHTSGTQLTMRIYYKGEDGSKKEIGGWVQTVDTSAPKEGHSNPSVDPAEGYTDKSGKKHDNYPYYDTKSEFAYNTKYAEYNGVKQDAEFHDGPNRLKSRGNFTWTAETSLMTKTSVKGIGLDGNMKTQTKNNPVMTLMWGFNQNKATPVRVVNPSVFHQNAVKQISK